MPHWLLVALGLNSASGESYLAYSGIVGDAGLLAAIVAFYLHHTCHVSGCWWYARRTTAAGERACFLHHPNSKRTWGDIHAAHHAAVAQGKPQPAPAPPADQAALLAELRGLRSDVTGLAETVRSLMLAIRTEPSASRGRQR